MQAEPLSRLRFIALGLLALVTLGLVFGALAKSRSSVTAAPPSPASSSPALPAPDDSSSPDPSARSSASPSPSASPAAPLLSAVVLGDDFSVNASWPQELGDSLDWEVINLSEKGMGYRVAPATCTVRPCTNFQGQIARVATTQPDVVVLAGGNADGDYKLDDFVKPVLAELSQALPQTRVVVISPLSDKSPHPYWLKLHATSLQKAATTAGVTYIDTSAVTADPNSYSKSSLTPAANTELAELIAAGLR